jgi:hypothetical protein
LDQGASWIGFTAGFFRHRGNFDFPACVQLDVRMIALAYIGACIQTNIFVGEHFQLPDAAKLVFPGI